jgi:type III pantothenate kinase
MAPLHLLLTMTLHLLTIDIGNTTTSFGVFSQKGSPKNPLPLKVDRVFTERLNQKSVMWRELSRIKGSQTLFKGVIVSSVVPSLNKPLEMMITKKFRLPTTFVTPHTPTQIKVRIKKPHELGADRLVNARGAWEYVKGACIVVDFGTATTFDCINNRREYLGGVIAPGPGLSARALYEHTAKLPHGHLEKPAHVLGRSTQECLTAGLYHGYRGLVKEILKGLLKQMKGRPQILLTGGQNAQWIHRGLPFPIHYLPHLTLQGLYFVWRDLNPGAQEI